VKKIEFYGIMGGLLGAELDGARRDYSGWHIDSIKRSLSDDKKLWYQKGLEYFIATYLTCRQILFPWMLEFVIYLKESKKPKEPKISSLKDLFKDFNDRIPPEIIAYLHEVNEVPPTKKMHFSFIPSYIDCKYYEMYDSPDSLYYRYLTLTIDESYEFPLMVARLFHRFSVDAVNLLKPRAIDERRISVLKKLLSKNPTNCPSLVELGALTLLSYLDIDEATRIFKQVLQYDPQNADACFWLATISYYCLIDPKKAQDYLKKALKINPNDARCLSFMHLVSWDITKSQEAGVPYLERAINIEPKWLLPRIQLALVLEFKGEREKPFHLLKGRPDIEISAPTSIIDRYYATYVTGNIRDNLLIIEEITRWL